MGLPKVKILIRMNCARCGHNWVYSGIKQIGNYPVYVSCPKCKTSVKLKVLK